MESIPTVFRRHVPEGTVTDVFEDECVWVRDREICAVDVIVGEQHLIPADLRTSADTTREDFPASFEEIRAFFQQHPVDTLIFHNADGRQAQVTRQDFGL